MFDRKGRKFKWQNLENNNLQICIGGLEQGFKTNLLASGHTNWNKNAEIKITSTDSTLS